MEILQNALNFIGQYIKPEHYPYVVGGVVVLALIVTGTRAGLSAKNLIKNEIHDYADKHGITEEQIKSGDWYQKIATQIREKTIATIQDPAFKLKYKSFFIKLLQSDKVKKPVEKFIRNEILRIYNYVKKI